MQALGTGGQLRLAKRVLCWVIWALMIAASTGNEFSSSLAFTPPSFKDSSQAEPATLNPRMRCTGAYLSARTCYFEDILWDVARERFVFYGNTFSQPHVFSDDLRSGDDVNTNDPWIKLKRFVAKPPPKKWTWHEFYMDWRLGQEYPPASTIADAPYPGVHLRTVINLSSFGHFLRDNLMPLVNVPLRFGQDPRDFVWVMCASNDAAQERTLRTTMKILQHYQSWMPSRKGRPTRVLWTTMISDVVNRYGEGSKPAFIRFPKLVAGRGSTAFDVHLGHETKSNQNKDLSRWAHFCSPWMWREMRDMAYGNNGIRMTPAAQLKPLVLIIDGQPNEKRYFKNGDEVVEHFKHKLPGVEVQRVAMSVLSGKQQLQLLARTTVMISNIGSRSFRMLYLPDGAQMILVGPPEIKRGRAGLSSFSRPFVEADRCWGFLGYINLLRHHVFMGVSQATGDGHKVRNTHITLDKDALLPTVQHALESVRLWTIPDFSSGKRI